MLITIRFCSIAYSLWTKSVICILPPRSHFYIALPSNSLTKKRSQSYYHWNITHNFHVQQACDNFWILRPFFFFCFFFLNRKCKEEHSFSELQIVFERTKQALRNIIINCNWKSNRIISIYIPAWWSQRNS